jgi:Tfp pilus assembly protein PilX
MTAPSLDANRLTALHRARRRRTSAGGTMFVVAMTIAVLSAIGAWALQSAALEVRMAGYERQSMQTHYLAEYGVLAAMQDLNATQLLAILQAPASGGNNCLSVSCVTGGTTFGCVPALTMTPIPKIDQTCAKWTSSSQIDSATNYPGVGWSSSTNPLDAPSGSYPTAVPGSFGQVSTTGDFSVEVSDVASGPARAGFSQMHFYWAIVSAYGQTNQNASGVSGVINDLVSQGDETLRTRIQVGPAP